MGNGLADHAALPSDAGEESGNAVQSPDTDHSIPFRGFLQAVGNQANGRYGIRLVLSRSWIFRIPVPLDIRVPERDAKREFFLRILATGTWP